MDGHTIVTIISAIAYTATISVFWLQLGRFTGELKALLTALKEDVAPMKKHDAQIAVLEARASMLEADVKTLQQKVNQ